MIAMAIPIILAVMLGILFLHGYVVRNRTSHHVHGVFFDVSGSHNQAFVNSMQDFAPGPRRRGFDTDHYMSMYWG